MKVDKVLLLILLQLMITSCIFMLEIFDHSLSNLEWSLFVMLYFISVLLLVKRWEFAKELQQIIVDLKRAVDGNLNTRILAHPKDLFCDVVFLTNELIAQLQNNEVKMLKFQAVRKRLLTSISHDIRTPLTSIIGYVDALKDDIAGSEEERKKYITIIGKKSNGLKQVINEIFEMAKLDADEVPFKPEILDLAEMIRETIIGFLPIIDKAEMRLEMSVPEKKCSIITDRLSIIRIIENLVKNAIYHGKEGKVLGIKLIETADCYQVQVWDQGSGLTKDELMHVFDRMYQTDRSRNPSSSGSGLGLAITKELVEKNAGTIWAESVPWQKTTFTFAFPKQTSKKEI